MTGGIIDKLGNLYEAKGAILGLFRVIEGEALSIRYESIVPQDHGVDWFLRYPDHEESVQAKRSTTAGNWKISALGREGVLKSAGEWLGTGGNHVFTFVSASPAPDMNGLCESAGHAIDSGSLLSALSRPQRNNFEHLRGVWGVSPDTALDFLKRSRFAAQAESLLDELIRLHGEISFRDSANSVFPILRAYIEEHMGLELSAESIVRELERGARLSFRPHLGPALWERLRDANRIFSESYPIFGACTPIHRLEADSITDALSDVEGPRLILLTGSAGSGKSFILKEVMSGLEHKTVPHLAFRVDKYLSARSLGELGRFVLGHDENPLMTLVEYAGNKPSVFFIDQVDAIGQVSGRSGPIRELVLGLLKIAREFNSVRVIAACRSYDLSNDPVLKEYAKEKMVLSIQAAPLKWTDEVEPLLRERGFDVSRMSPSMRSILTSPLNLAILLELGMDQDMGSLTECTDIAMLYDRLIFQKSEHLADIETMATLAKIARRMSEDQVLDVPDAIIEPTVIKALASEQLILHLRSRIAFFHETFFDYVYARDFVGQSKSIVEFLRKDEQILFRRTQVRQILSYYRQTGGARRSRYFTELKEVLNSSDVRYHIKDGIASWLGSLSDPSEGELDLMLKLDTPDSGMPYLVRKAIYPQSPWASTLAQRGVLGKWLRSSIEARRNDSAAVLTALFKVDQALAVDILESYWREAPIDRLTIVQRWLMFASDSEPSESLVRFMCEVIAYETDDDNKESSFDHIIPYTWYSRYPKIAGRLLSAFFFAWLETHPGEHPFSQNRSDIISDHILEKLRKDNLEVYLDTVLPIFLATIERINIINAKGFSDFAFYIIHEGYDFGSDGFFYNIRLSLAELANYNPGKADNYLTSIDPHLHASCLYLHLSTIAAGGAELAWRLPSLIGIPGILEAGPSGATWLPFVNAVKIALPFLNPDICERIETMILGYWPELRYASEIARKHKVGEETTFTSRESAYSYLHASGNTQWAIFKTIGIQSFSSLARIRFETLDRKFEGTVIPEPHTIIGGWVPPPIPPNRAQLMSDIQWIRAIKNYQSEMASRRRQGRSFKDMHSGSLGLSQVLREQAKAAPERFARLCMQLPADANPEYGDAILHSLADSKIDITLLLPVFYRLNSERNSGFCSGFCQMVSARPELALVDDAFELLLWYAENGPVHSSGEFEELRIRQDMFSIDQLLGGMDGMMVLHGDRAAAVRALAYVIAHCVERREAAMEALKARLVDEGAECIRCALSEPLLYALETLPDKHEAIGLLESLAIRAGDFDPYPLTNYHGISLLHRLLYLFPQDCVEIVEGLLVYPDEKVRQLGAYFAYYQTFISVDYRNTFAVLLGAKMEFRHIDAGLAAQFIAENQGKEYATKKLIHYFDDPDEKTRKSAIQCFRYLSNKPLGPYRELLDAYIRSTAFAQADYFFYEFIKNALDCSRDVVITIGERVLELLKSNTDGDFRFDMATIGEMLNEEYSSTFDVPNSRTRILNLIDGMLQVGMYGVEQIVEEHERR